jgi:F0F1-type ATP synthase assembly protein I
MPDDKGTDRREYRQLLEASAIGWMFPIAMGLGFGLGYGLDKLFNTWPWLTLICSGLGVIAAFIQLFRISAASDGG